MSLFDIQLFFKADIDIDFDIITMKWQIFMHNSVMCVQLWWTKTSLPFILLLYRLEHKITAALVHLLSMTNKDYYKHKKAAGHLGQLQQTGAVETPSVTSV